MFYTIADDNGDFIQKQLIKYHFAAGEHDLPEAPHGNSKGSTPYKRQPQSTRDLLRIAAEDHKPKVACKKVEKELGGIENVDSTSSLPRNSQQVATIRRQLFTFSNHSDPIMALVDLFKTELSGFIRSLQLLPSPSCVLATDAQLQELIIRPKSLALCTLIQLSILAVFLLHRLHFLWLITSTERLKALQQ